MYNIDFNNPVHVHFIGIGGISMSGLAHILLGRKFTVTGSDNNPSSLTDELTSEGAVIAYSQTADNITDDIDVVVCQNDNEAYGAITAIQEKGLTCGVDGDIIIISFDATNGGFLKMIAGEINVDVECNPLEGPLVAEIIQKLEKGESVDKIQYVEEGVYPADTAADIIDSRAY